MVLLREMTLEDSDNIHDIDRSETINFVYQLKSGRLEERSAGHECPSWQEEEYLKIISRYEEELRKGGIALGAYDGDTLVGFGVLAHKFLGAEEDQLQLDLMYVSRTYRRRGIGRQIFEALSEVALQRGAKRLYISSTETESAVNFYSSMGSSIASKVDEDLFEKEPDDIHMEKKL